MAVYGPMTITTAGLALYAKAQTGVTLNFTRMQIGSGLLTGQSIPSLTGLITPIAYFSIISAQSSGSQATIRGVFDNAGLATSKYSCEIGLFAQDPTAGEILYAYVNAGAQGDTIPPISAGPFAKQYQINAAVGNASSVTATVPAGVYIPTTDRGAANGVASLGSDSRVPVSQLPFSGGNQYVVKVNAGILETDTRSTPLTYTSGKLTKVEEKDGSTVVKTSTLNYSGSRLDTVVEVAGGSTVTSTLVYDGSGNLTNVTRGVV